MRRKTLLIGLIFLFSLILIVCIGNVSSSSYEKEEIVQDLFLDSISNFASESVDFLLFEGNTLSSYFPPVTINSQVMGVLQGSNSGIDTRKEIITYEVQSGDSLWGIASKFNISLDTLIWANDFKKIIIQPGQELLILPVSGVMHIVENGDTVTSIAKEYKADSNEVIAFNDLSGKADIVENEILVIPGGKRASVSIVQRNVVSSNLSTNNFYGQSHAFPYGQCTYWVAQRRAIPNWGNAKDWLGNAAYAGYATCSGRYCIPQVGAVVSLYGSVRYGHVAYVEEVKGDKVVFSEMNYIGLGRMNYRTVRIGSTLIKGYIY